MSRKVEIKATIRDKRGKVLSVGTNNYSKSHPLQYSFAAGVGKPDAIYLHAEMDALIRCRDISKAYSIHVERYYSDGRPALAKPCSICMAALKHYGVKEITWSGQL